VASVQTCQLAGSRVELRRNVLNSLARRRRSGKGKFDGRNVGEEEEREDSARLTASIAFEIAMFDRGSENRYFESDIVGVADVLPLMVEKALSQAADTGMAGLR